MTFNEDLIRVLRAENDFLRKKILDFEIQLDNKKQTENEDR